MAEITVLPGIVQKFDIPDNPDLSGYATSEELLEAKTGLQEGIDTLDNSLGTAQNAITANETSISSNTNAIAENVSDISSNETAISSNTTSISTNANKITQVEDSLTTTQGNITTIEGNVTTNTSNIAGHATEIESLDTRVTDLENEVPSGGGDYQPKIAVQKNNLQVGDGAGANLNMEEDENNLGANNVMFGVNALGNATDASFNFALGKGSLINNDAGNQNVAIGNSTFRYKGDVNKCVGIGNSAFRSNNTDTPEDNAAENSIGIGNGVFRRANLVKDSIAIGVESAGEQVDEIDNAIFLGNKTYTPDRSAEGDVKSIKDKLYIGSENSNVISANFVDGATTLHGDVTRIEGFVYSDKSIAIGGKKLVFNSDNTVTWTQLNSDFYFKPTTALSDEGWTIDDVYFDGNIIRASSDGVYRVGSRDWGTAYTARVELSKDSEEVALEVTLTTALEHYQYDIDVTDAGSPELRLYSYNYLS